MDNYLFAVLLQIATEHRVYIFDLHALSNKKDLVEIARSVLLKIFSSDRIIKLGWDFTRSDAKQLRLSGRGLCVLTVNAHMLLNNISSI